jgi:hypothetical protein
MRLPSSNGFDRSRQAGALIAGKLPAILREVLLACPMNPGSEGNQAR